MKNGSFPATAWKVTGDGGTLPAPPAFIQATPPYMQPVFSVIKLNAGTEFLCVTVCLHMLIADEGDYLSGASEWTTGAGYYNCGHRIVRHRTGCPALQE
jgi:hypothetical protein